VSQGGLSFIDTSGNLRIWDPSVKCETKSFLESGVTFIGPLTDDVRCDGVLLKHRNFDENMGTKILVNGQLAASEIEAEDRRTIGEDAGDRKWVRSWFRPNIVGQGFTVRVEVDAGQRFATNYLELTAQKAGAFRGRLV
jgi:hypothetical protein